VEPRLGRAQEPAQLLAARRARHASAHDVSRRRPQSQSGARGRRRRARTLMSESPKHAPHTESLAVAPPIVGPGHTFATVTDKISAVVLTRKTPLAFIAAFGVAFLLFNVFLV